MSYSVRGDRQSKEIHLVLEPRKCLFFYHYFHHPIFGFMHVRVQSWFPFTVDLCLNGRHWLARQLDQQGISYRQRDNCFVWVSDWAKAQSLLREQCHFKWKAPLTFLLHQVNPLVSEICRPIRQSYYWTASETEYATDLAFAQPEELAKLYPRFVHHGISSFASPDVMRFLGRWTPTTTGRVYGQFDGQIISDLKHRSEGIRVKHSLNGNSIKVYDKQGSVLRVETTINKPAEFKVYRAKENDPQGPLAWRELRRGLADLPRRAEVSHQSNNRYLSALASVTGTTALAKVVAKVCVPRTFQGRRHRALRPWSPEDQAFLEAMGRGEFTVNGFRNRDLRRLLHPQRASSQKQRRQAAAIGRKLRLLRIHGLVRKVSGTHRYVVTDGGRQILTALACARNADVDQLTKMAA